MIGATFCSGIGAPELAAPWVDWRFGSEIEPFPRAVLQDRFGYRLPEDQNQGEPLLWGDMTEVTPDLLRSRGIPLPELVVAGTPCQAFSVAGLRKGTEDARGNLTLKFVEILHELVAARPDGKLAVLWENVPGVLSDKGNAFGCFLGGLVGAVDALQPPTVGSWPGEGMVQGPRARAAWCVLDAQWFGVAQRRRRVFVVVDFGGAVDPAAVLLEPDRLRGNSAPRREAGKDLARSVGESPANRGIPDVSPALKARDHKGPSSDGDGDGAPILPVEVTHSLRGEGFDASEDGTGRGTPIVPVAGTLCRDSFTGGPSGRPEGAAAGHFVPVAFDCKGTEVQFTEDDCHPTLRSMGHSASHQNAGGHAAVAFQDRARGDDGRGYDRPPPISEEIIGTLETVKQWNVALPWAVRRLTPRECERLQGMPDDHTLISWRGKALSACPDGPRYKAIGNSMAVPCIKWILDRIKTSHQQMRIAA